MRDLFVMNRINIALIENHPGWCMRNHKGLAWRSHILLLCYSMKILSDTSSLLLKHLPTTAAHISRTAVRPWWKKLFIDFGCGLASLNSTPFPHLLSSLRLGTSELFNVKGDLIIHDPDQDKDGLSNHKLEVEPKDAAYFDDEVEEEEEDYNRRPVSELRQKKKKNEINLHNITADKCYEGDIPLPEYMVVLPLSFDGDDTAYRYRAVMRTSIPNFQLLATPDKWDHDYGYDYVSKQGKGYAFHLLKDKKDFDVLVNSVLVEEREHEKQYYYGTRLLEYCIDLLPTDGYIMCNSEVLITEDPMLKKYKSVFGSYGIVRFGGVNAIASGFKMDSEMAIGKTANLSACVGFISDLHSLIDAQTLGRDLHVVFG